MTPSHIEKRKRLAEKWNRTDITLQLIGRTWELNLSEARSKKWKGMYEGKTPEQAIDRAFEEEFGE